MELALQQKLVARLCTDRAFREEFFAAPAKVAAHQGLTVAAEGLATLHPEQLRQFARLLRTRRLGEAGTALPLTRRALGFGFADLFKAYAIQGPPPGERPGEDAVAFVDFMERQTATQPLEPAWVRSLARYEAARVEAEWLGQRKLVVRRFPHALRRLLAAFAAGGVPEGSFSGWTLAVWCCASSGRKPRHWLW
jgi:hypothetical protein